MRPCHGDARNYSRIVGAIGTMLATEGGCGSIGSDELITCLYMIFKSYEIKVFYLSITAGYGVRTKGVVYSPVHRYALLGTGTKRVRRCPAVMSCLKPPRFFDIDPLIHHKSELKPWPRDPRPIMA